MSARDRPYTGQVAVLSALPARIRWRVPALIDRGDLAQAVVADLVRHPVVRQARASPLTGAILAELASATPVGRAEHWLRQSLARQLARDPGARPVARSVSTGAKSEPSRHLLELSEPHREKRRRAIAWSLLNGLEDAVPPLLVGLAANTATQGANSVLGRLGLGSPASRLLGLGGLAAALWLSAAAIEYRKSRVVADLARSVALDLRTTLYEHVQGLDLAEVEAKDVSDWMAILDQDVTDIEDFLRSGIDPLFQTVTNLVFVGATLAVASPAAVVVQLLTLPVLGLVSVALLRPIRIRHGQKREHRERWDQIVSGNLAGMATIAGFGAEASEAARVREAGSEYRASTDAADEIEAVY
ncbi:MAG: hypothetical protein MI919_22525, partial [Holophagales bacterium]|nr:hypothetical protein [Holophagales bacterium]